MNIGYIHNIYYKKGYLRIRLSQKTPISDYTYLRKRLLKMPIIYISYNKPTHTLLDIITSNTSK